MYKYIIYMLNNLNKIQYNVTFKDLLKLERSKILYTFEYKIKKQIKKKHNDKLQSFKRHEN
jgi:hypothetical protein